MKFLFRQSKLLQATLSMRGPKKQVDAGSIAPAVLKIFKDQTEEPKSKGFEELPSWAVNLVEPHVNWITQVHIMSNDTDIFYPTVENYAAHMKKHRKHFIRHKNNETVFKNNRFEVTDRPLENEPIDDYAFTKDLDRQASAMQKEEAAKLEKEEEEGEEGEEEEEITEEEMRRLDIE